MPCEKKAAERVSIDRLDFLAETRERTLPQRAQHIGVHPVRLAPAGPELTLHHTPCFNKAGEKAFDCFRVNSEAGAHLNGRERRMCPGVARDKVQPRVGHWLLQR